MDFSLPKKDILRSKRDIDALFAADEHLSKFPLRVHYRTGTGTGVTRMMVSVPKRNFKRAVKRNLLKRRVREAFRLNRSMLGGAGIDILFVYSGKEILDYAAIESAVRAIFQQLLRRSEESGKLSADTAGEVLPDLHITV